MSQSGCDSVDVTRYSASTLARRIASGELSASQVVEAHIQRIEQVDQRLNAVAVPRWQQARQDAQEADQARNRGEKLGPLHGVPVTIKEMFDVEGIATTAGITSRRRHRAQRDASLVARLRHAGAIILGKTNVPQMGMMVETDNPVYGRTNNPWNLDRSPGGSSGGEASIIAAGGSPLGLGSDGGGSIRIPCHACGIHGLKPTSRRLPLAGHWTLPHWPSDWVQGGPMARRVEDLWLAMQVLAPRTEEPMGLDGVLVAMGDPSGVRLDQLRIGMYTDIGDIRCAPALRRAVEEAAETLRQRGATVESFSPPDVSEAWQIYMSVLYADGLSHVKHALKRSVRDQRIKQCIHFTKAPSWMRTALACLLERLGQRHIGQSFRILPERVVTTTQYQQLLQRQQAYRQRFARAVQTRRLDAILCPPSPSPAILHGEFYANFGLIYTALYNLLGTPAGVVTTTRVREGEESDRPESRDLVERAFARIETGSAGLPVGVQVVARWWREDVVLAVMQGLEEHAHQVEGYPFHPPF